MFHVRLCGQTRLDCLQPKRGNSFILQSNVPGRVRVGADLESSKTTFQDQVSRRPKRFERYARKTDRRIVFCATRRQECEAMVNGFDTDFVLVLDPSDPKIATQIKKIIDDVEQKLDCRQKFWLKIDFAGLLDELTMPSSKISFTGSTGSFTSPITANQTRFCNITCGIFGSPCFQFSY